MTLLKGIDRRQDDRLDRKAMQRELSVRQRRMYVFICHTIRSKGRPPTIREIGREVEISSTSVVNYNLGILAREGLIQRDKEISRGLRVIDRGTNAGDIQSDLVRIPLLGTIVAGHPLPVPGEGLGQFEGEAISLTRDIVQDRDGLFALKVKGDSMLDALIFDGDFVVLKKQETAEDGEMVAVWLIDEKATTLKRIFREKNSIRLQSMNPTMKPRYEDPRNVQVQGKVVLVIRQLRKETSDGISTSAVQSRTEISISTLAREYSE